MPKQPPNPVHPWDIPAGKLPSVWKRVRPAQMLAGSFLLLIGLGTLGLKYLPGLYTGEPLGWLDSLFTAASAVCVTGLTVVDISTQFTPRGQAFLLLLIQLGGLGMLTVTSLIIVALGRRLTLRSEQVVVASPVTDRLSPRTLVKDIVRFTLAIEAVGALLLFALWVPELGWREAAWSAIFHSISAFCNAGFSTFSDSLVGFRESPLSLSVIMLLIIAGGVGFLPMEELYQRHKARRAGRGYRLCLHTQLVLATTGILLVGGWLLFLVTEWRGELAGLGFFDRVFNALFMSVTARTAGFNTVDYGNVSEAGLFLTILLMTIGGAPGSTSGGLKTTTFAVLAALAWSRLKGYDLATVRGRSLRKETTDRAVAVFVITAVLVTAGLWLLTMTDGDSGWGGFRDRMFEAVSAFNTVGLSTGQTPELSSAGRWAVVVLMFVGRVGPLTISSAIARKLPARSRFRYAYEEVMVG